MEEKLRQGTQGGGVYVSGRVRERMYADKGLDCVAVDVDILTKRITGGLIGCVRGYIYE